MCNGLVNIFSLNDGATNPTKIGEGTVSNGGSLSTVLDEEKIKVQDGVRLLIRSARSSLSSPYYEVTCATLSRSHRPKPCKSKENGASNETKVVKENRHNRGVGLKEKKKAKQPTNTDVNETLVYVYNVTLVIS